jgi:dTDP-4-amino-4,6-dideoxy-D-galactose acyltransferase
MYNTLIEYLSWDSDFFSKKIGRINLKSQENLEVHLKEAKIDGYQLVYVFEKKESIINENILTDFNGKLVDKKIIYEKKIINSDFLSSSIIEYKDNELTPELEQLAYVSGKYSRFRLDKKFSEDDFFRMYKTWLDKSVKHEIADNVFVAVENAGIKGMITLKNDGKKGVIGLIAVSIDKQKKGYGKALIAMCENELFHKGIFKIEVSTQADNIPACNFYEKCAFQKKEIINIYHFWL